MSRVNQTARARIAWAALVAAASSRRTTTYGQLGAAVGVHHRAVRYVLGPIQDYCLEAKLPPLTILVVNSSGLPGSGFIAHDLDDFEQGLETVWSYDWRAEPNPFDFAADGTSFESLVNLLAQAPEDAEDVYVLVKSRGIKQLMFRDALLKAYSERCAFSGIGYLVVLEACHIVPWSHSTPQQRLDVRNGLLLNSLHHRLFDRGILTITPALEIVFFEPKGSEREHSQLERSLTTSLHGRHMQAPRLTKHRPLAANIEQHNTLLERHP